jgi:ABC-type uncharacterized transport system substrate-binding protein
MISSRPIAIAALLAAAPLPALAHPHVFAEARLDVVVSPDRHVTALRHVWRFDDLFSSTVLVEFDANKDLVLDDKELQEVASTVYDSLNDYGYFQIVTADGKDVAMNRPKKLIADFQDNQLIILFESTPKNPLLLAGKVSFGIYDPTFYTAIEFLDDEHMAVEGMPDGCKRAVIRPDPDEAIAQNQDKLTEDFFNDPMGNDLGSIFATRLEITCAANG